MTQNLYYHVFGTAREKSLDGTQDNPTIAVKTVLDLIKYSKAKR